MYIADVKGNGEACLSYIMSLLLLWSTFPTQTQIVSDSHKALTRGETLGYTVDE